MTPDSLSRRVPDVTVDRLLAHLVPPPQFAQVSFDSYIPDSQQPSQTEALSHMRQFAWGAPEKKMRGWRKRHQSPDRPGVYLDGGFGVGKTHLLASCWHVHPGPKAYGTFVEYTNLIGMLGFQTAVEAFGGYRLVCIDEFELDDPGDTVLMSTFLGQLVDRGVRLAATSNTLPDKLGEGRFAAEDFLREIQNLASHFDVIRIDGPDYRHRDTVARAPVHSTADLDVLARRPDTTRDDFQTLIAHLRTIHPSSYGELVDHVSLSCFDDVTPLTDQADALRFVVFIDRLYDRRAAIAGSGTSLSDVFLEPMLAGGYRKKYFRCLSRIGSMAQI